MDKRDLLMPILIHRGIYFHSQFDYINLVSFKLDLSTLGIREHLRGLMDPHRYDIDIGSKYFFVYPTRISNKNWVVIGFGETVYTLQEERKGKVKVPYIQYFLIKLSDFLISGLHPKLLESYLIKYEDIFIKFLRNPKLKIESIIISDKVDFEYKNWNGNDLYIFDVEPIRKKSLKLYTKNYEEALFMYYWFIKKIPRVTRWCIRVTISPKDNKYPADISIVYPEPLEDIKKIESNDLKQILEMSALKVTQLESDQDLLVKFEKFVKINGSGDLITFFEDNELERIIEVHDSFIISCKNFFLINEDKLIHFYKILNDFENCIKHKTEVKTLNETLTKMIEFEKAFNIFTNRELFNVDDYAEIKKKLSEIMINTPLPLLRDIKKVLESKQYKGVLYDIIENEIYKVSEIKKGFWDLRRQSKSLENELSFLAIKLERKEIEDFILFGAESLKSSISEVQNLVLALNIIEGFILRLCKVLGGFHEKLMNSNFNTLMHIVDTILLNCCEILIEKIKKREIETKYENTSLETVIQNISEKVKKLNQYYYRQNLFRKIRSTKFKNGFKNILSALEEAEIKEIKRKFHEFFTLFE